MRAGVLACLSILVAVAGAGAAQARHAGPVDSACASLDLQAGVSKQGLPIVSLGGSYGISVYGPYTFTLTDETGTVRKQVSFEAVQGTPPPQIFQGGVAGMVPGGHTLTGTLSGPCGSATSTVQVTVPQTYVANYLNGLSFTMTFTGTPKQSAYAGCYANDAISLLGKSTVTPGAHSAPGWEAVSSPKSYFSTETYQDKPYTIGGQVVVRASAHPTTTRLVYFNASVANGVCPASVPAGTPQPITGLVLDAGSAAVCGTLSYTHQTPNTFALSVSFRDCGGPYDAAPNPAGQTSYLGVAKWALGQIGRTSARINERNVLAKYGADWQPTDDGPAGEWAGDDWRFVSLAWMEQRVATKTGVNAYGAMQFYAGKRKLQTSGVPPAGAIVFYSGSGNAGGAAISLGNGQAVGPTGSNGDGSPIGEHAYKVDGRLAYRGYVTDPKP